MGYPHGRNLGNGYSVSGRSPRRAKSKKSPGGFARRLLVEPLEPRQLLSLMSPIISEFLASNTLDTGLKDSDSTLQDWLEIYYPGSEAVDLTGWTLRDDGNTWDFPAMSLGGGQFRVIFASGKDRRNPAGELATNFSLKKSGERLELLDSNSNVVHGWDPYPEQKDDVSFGVGQEIMETHVLAAGADARYLIPADNGIQDTWMGTGFNDAAWAHGPTGVGHANLVPGFAVWNYKSNSAIPNLTTALTVLGSYAWEQHRTDAVFNYLSSGGSGNYANDLAYPGLTIGVDADNYFVTKGVGKLYIPTAGAWTFGVNSDDGFQLRIIGATFNWVDSSGATISGDTLKYETLRGANNSLGVINSLDVGWYDFEVISFENEGGASSEFFAALGNNPAFNGSVFDLVGDTANSGLEVKSQAFTGGSGGFGSLIETDVGTVNTSLYTRIHFDVPDLAVLQSLGLKIKYDDGFVAYLNGQEAARANAPATPAWDSSAAAERLNGPAITYQDFDISDMTGFLVPGTNVLAIQGMNAAADNPDFLVLPELDATTTPEVTAQGRYFVIPTPGAANGAGTQDLGPVVTNVPPPAVQPTDADPILVTALVRPTSSPITAGSVTLHYRVNFGGELTLPMSDDGAHGDGAAGDGTYGATIPADASLPGQMVRWYVTATDDLGRQGRWPLPQDPYPVGTRRTPEYVGTMIADPTVTSSMPILYWFVEDPTAATTTTGTRASVYYDGEFYDNVFCRFRGGYATGGTKIDFNRGQYFRFSPDYARVSEVNLNCQGGLATDDAWVRPIVSFETFRDAGCPYSLSFMMRVQQTSPGGTATMFRVFVEQPDERYLERQGLYGDGALYKLVADVPGMQNATSFEKKNRDEEGYADLQAFLDGIHQASDAKVNYILDNVNIPMMLDYLAATVLIEEMDAVQKNFYLYRDTPDAGNPNGTGEWMMLPWDKHLTFGKNYGIADYQAKDPQAHPFLGDSEHPKIDGAGAWNYLIDAILDIPAVKEMYRRRLRTLMDQLLQTPDTPYATRYYETRLDALYTQLMGDAQFVGQQGNRQWAFDDIKTKYLDARRDHFFLDHGANANYPDSAGIPTEQPVNPTLLFGAYDSSPVSGNQDEEYIEVRNPNAFAIDISGWELQGAVQHTFLPGTVIPAGGSLYVTPNARAFRARTTGPRGGQGLLIQGNSKGHLSNWGEAVRLVDDRGGLKDAFTTPLAPTDPQRYLRITELQYHPKDPAAAPSPEASYLNDDFEYIELKNTSATQTIDLAGVTFSGGVAFTFPAMTLGPGQYALVVGNVAAFQARYGHAYDGIIAGPFAAGNLNNGGEQVRLDDAQGSTILAFTYSETWYPNTDSEGFSLTILDPAAADRGLWDSKDGWRPSRLAGGSPGTDDVDLAPGAIEVSEVLAHQDTEPPGDWIELKNTSAAPVDLNGWYLSDDPANLTKYCIIADANHPTTVIQPGDYMVFTESADFGPLACATGFALSELGDSVYLTSVASPGGALAGYRESREFSASDREAPFTEYAKSTGGTDFVAESAKTPGAANAYPLVGPVVVGGTTYSPGVVFSEVMYHPADGGDEFIELRNMAGVDVPLYDPANPANTWKFTDGIAFAFPAGSVIPANQYALVVGIDPAAFRAKYAVPAAAAIFGPCTGALANGGETLELSRPGEPESLPPYTVPSYRVDRLTYGDSTPWPEWADGHGSPLIRKAADYGNDAANWEAGNAGGTPGAANIPLDPTSPSAPTGLTATPVGTSRIDLAWAAAGDPDTGVRGYDIYRNGLKIAAATGTTFSFTNVYPSITYTYEVAALNRDGVESGLSGPATTRIVGIESAGAADACTVKLTFTELMDRDSAQDAALYAVTHAGGPMTVSSAVLQPDRRTVFLTLAAPMTPGVAYTVSAHDVLSRAGYRVQAGTQQSFTYTPPVAGAVLREYWLNIGGGTVADLTGNPSYPDSPSGREPLASFETAPNWGDAYGDRLRSYITAPATGSYTFWISSDDASELWLSTDEDPANAARIAYVSGWTNWHEWTREANQSSANVVGAISLTAGQRYYIEAIHKEGGGGDHLSVRWQLPDATIEEPIPGSRLTLFVPTGSVLREWWTGLSGTAVSNLTNDPNYPDSPTGISYPNSLEAPKNWNDSYGTRLRSYVTAPATGAYTFWIASDDASELWLSTNDDPANARRIAYVSGWTNWREWTREANQNSANAVGAINLVAGQRYYIEALQKEGGGGDHLSVRWQLPDAAIEEPIPAGRLTLFVPTLPTVSIAATDPDASETGPDKGTFTISRTGDTTRALTVYYTVTGTASGPDIQEDLTQTAVIPAGASSVNIDATPVDDAIQEPGQTVHLALVADRRYDIGTGQAAVTIADNDPNHPPVIAAHAFSVAEKSPNGTVVGTVTATDPDEGQTPAYAITAGNANGVFAIDAATGRITVNNSSALDHETQEVCTLTVQVTDTGAPPQSSAATVTVTVGDVNEAPVINGQAFSVDERSPNGTVVGTVVASDPDEGQTPAYAITAGNTNNVFAIDPATGRITVNNSAALDHEAMPTCTLTVQATDSAAPPLGSTATVTVTVNDVIEPTGDPIIAEFMANNNTTLQDQDGDFPDWIEIHNSGATGINLVGFYLTDDPANLTKWRFPSTFLPAGGYLVVFASDKNRAAAGQELHTNFKMDAAGEYLALVRPDGHTIATEFWPQFPGQYADISYGYGQNTYTKTLVGPEAATVVRIPSAPVADWTNWDYDDSGWTLRGTSGVGYESLVPGFAVTDYFANGDILSLAEAESVIGTPSKQTRVVSQNDPVINYSNGQYFGGDLPYPGTLITDNPERLVTQAAAAITIPVSDYYTFGVSSDDGFGLTIWSAADSFHIEFAGLRGNGATLGSHYFTAGTYELRLVSFENYGGQSVELYAARGQFAGFDYTNFHLVGDTGSGGLRVDSVPIAAGGGAGVYGSVIHTNVEAEMKGVNPSACIRIPFTIADLAPYNSLALKVKYDDGFVAYLNGVEVARRNAPETVTWNSAAPAERAPADALVYEEIDISVHLGLLRLGQNVLAIQGLNYGAADNDFLVLPELVDIDYLGLGLHYFAAPSPRAANLADYYAYVADTQFDHDRGFYDAAFDLAITTETPDATIRYTLDGSVPTASTGEVYTGPIPIATTTVLRAAAFKEGYEPANVDTQTYVFLDDVIHQPANPPGFPTTWGTVSADYEMDPTVVNDLAYSALIKDALKSIPTMSIVANLNDLFGPSGIYSYPTQSSDPTIPASLEYFNAGGGKDFQTDAGVKIYGNVGRDPSFRKHTFRLKFTADYGPTKLNFDLFGGRAVEQFDTLILRSNFNDAWVWGDTNVQYIREQWNYEAQLLMGGLSSHGTFVHLYVNGLYWGLYNPVERPDDAFAASYLGGDKTEYDARNCNETGPIAGDEVAWNQMFNLANTGNIDGGTFDAGALAGDANYQAIQQYLDVPGLADYVLMNYYGGNWDWDGHNWYAARRRVPGAGYQFFSWDAEGSLGANWTGLGVGANVTGVNNDRCPTRLFQQLRANPEFRLLLMDRIYKHFFNNGVFTSGQAAALYQDLAAEVEQAIIGESARWGDLKREPPYTRDGSWATTRD